MQRPLPPQQKEPKLNHRLLPILLLIAVLLLAACGSPSSAPASLPTQSTLTAGPPSNAAAVRPTAPVQPDPPSPPPAALPPHPRLFVQGRTATSLQAQAATTHVAIWEPIATFVAGREGQLPPATPPPDTSMSAYRTYGNVLLADAFVCLVTEADEPCTLARESLLIFAGWPQWDVDAKRDLGHAHMLQANAIAYDWLYTRLAPAERETVRASLAQRADELYLAASSPYEEAWNNWWTTSPMQNHYMIKHAALGTAALALLDEHPAAEQWLSLAQARLSILTALLEGIGDGTWHEGISYQHYGLTQVLPFWVNLRAMRGVDLIPHTYMQSYGAWRVYNHLPQSLGFIMTHGDFEWDWIATGLATNLLRYVAANYNDGLAEWLVQQMEQQSGRDANEYQAPWYVYEFLYYDPAVPATSPDSLPLARVFPDLTAVIWRTGWQPDDLVFGFKAGVYGGQFAYTTFVNGDSPWPQPCEPSACQLNIGHNHRDTNSFTLARGRVWLVPENVGNEQYQTEYHNTLLIDGQGQFRPDRQRFDRDPAEFADSAGRLLSMTHTAALDHLAAEATQRYRQIDGLTQVVRHALFVRPHYFLIVDDLAATSPHTYTWLAHTTQPPIVEPDGWLRSDAEAEQVLGILPLAPADLSITTTATTPPAVQISPATPTPTTRLVHLLYPTTAAAWADRPQVQLLEDTGAALAVQVQHATGHNDTLLLRYADPAGAPTAAAVTVGLGGAGAAWTFDGRAALVQRAPDAARIGTLVLIGGTRLVQGNTPLIELPEPASAPIIVYDTSSAIDIETASSLPPATRIQAAPTITAVRENGVPRAFTFNGTQIELQ